MITTTDSINQLKNKALQELEAVSSWAQLEQWRVTYLGRKGVIPQWLRTLKDLPLAERKEKGEKGNIIRQELEAACNAKKSGLPQENSKTSSRNPDAESIGHLHPLTVTMRRIQAIFAAMGFMIVEGPEVEDVKHSFDLLNIPAEHPARSQNDTFYLTNGSVLRVQTSSMQLRAVQEYKLQPPFKILSPGRVFRAESTDATHETTFYQFEGLAVGTDITIADFKGVIETFYSTFFQKDIFTRLRPSYFPFVEPGFEVDISCVFCGGSGCRVCKRTGWIEVMGAGMVHPVVLHNMGLDSDKYQGFAFGGAVDRLAMIRHGVGDIRLFWSGDVRFLRQFS